MWRALAILPALAFPVHAEEAPRVPPPARVHPWRASDDVVDGWDWSLPPDVRPAQRSGVTFSGAEPPGFPGNRLVAVDWTWARLEPEEGEYEFDELRRAVQRAGGDGVLLRLQAATGGTQIRKRGRRVSRPGTAPAWLTERYGVAVVAEPARENLETPFVVSNLDVTDPQYHARYLAMVRALGESGIPGMPEIAFAVVSGVSASRGEEAGLAARDERMIACMTERLEAWAEAFRGNEWKLAWVGDGDRGSPLLARAYALGMGQRCGTAERYLMHLSSPGLGQRLDDDGHLVVDESCPPIAGRRAFGDENEEYDPAVHVPRFGPTEGWAYRYRESMLRALQMRRNWIWAENDPWVDPPLLSFVSLELGRDVTDAPDAWCELRESRVRVGGEVRAVRNFERWLVQRDVDGARTVPALPAAVAAAPGVSEWTARRTDAENGSPRMGFALDDRFLSGGPHDVAIKVTYVDVGRAAWELAVPAAAGGEMRRGIRCGDTGAVRTATFFLEGAAFPASVDDFDFGIRALEGDAVVCFVRVIRR